MKIIITFLLIPSLFILEIHAQSTVFSEDFESSTMITTFENTFGNDLPDGPSPCGKAARGTTADFNSTNVDFLNAENNTNFLGVNPEDPCGGYYSATVASTSSFDFSSADSLVFKCRYYMSSTLDWGPTNIEITFNNGTDTQVLLPSEFSVTDTWTEYEIDLDAIMVGASAVDMTISIDAGDGVALDDIEILNYEPSATLTNEEKEEISVFPNPFNDAFTLNVSDQLLGGQYKIVSLAGKILSVGTLNQKKNEISTNILSGIYLVVVEKGEAVRIEKVVKY